jgi:hypothetical protein
MYTKPDSPSFVRQVVSNAAEADAAPATAAKRDGIADLLSMDLTDEAAAATANGGISATQSSAAGFSALQDLLSGDLSSALPPSTSSASAGEPCAQPA